MLGVPVSADAFLRHCRPSNVCFQLGMQQHVPTSFLSVRSAYCWFLLREVL
jgi:hypothetical protein